MSFKEALDDGREDWEKKDDEDRQDGTAAPPPTKQEAAVDLLDTAPNSVVRKQIPPNLSASQKLAWHKKEDVRIVQEEKKLENERAKKEKQNLKKEKQKAAEDAKAAKASAAKV
jgi:hypothetical protein